MLFPPKNCIAMGVCSKTFQNGKAVTAHACKQAIQIPILVIQGEKDGIFCNRHTVK